MNKTAGSWITEFPSDGASTSSKIVCMLFHPSLTIGVELPVAAGMYRCRSMIWDHYYSAAEGSHGRTQLSIHLNLHFTRQRVLSTAHDKLDNTPDMVREALLDSNGASKEQVVAECKSPQSSDHEKSADKAYRFFQQSRNDRLESKKKYYLNDMFLAKMVLERPKLLCSCHCIRMSRFLEARFRVSKSNYGGFHE